METQVILEGIEKPVTVKYDYEPAERGARESFGVPLEPDYPANVIMYEVWLGDTDITALIDQADLWEEIESDILSQHTSEGL